MVAVSRAWTICIGAMATVVLFVASASPGATPSPATEELCRQFVSQQTANERLRVRRELLEAALHGPRARNAVRDDTANRNLQAAATEFRAVIASAERDWLAARSELLGAEIARFDRTVQWRDSGGWIVALYWTERIAWWAGPPALLVLLATCLIVFRHAVRRQLGAYAGLIVVLVLGVAGLAAAIGMTVMLREPTAPATHPLTPPLDALAAAIAQGGQDRAVLKSEVDQLEQDLANDARAQSDAEVRQVSRDLAECAAVHAFLVRSRRTDTEAAATINADLAARADDALAARSVRAAIGVGLLALSVAGLWLLARAVKGRQRRLTNSCAACGKRGTLQVDRRTGVSRCGNAACGFDLSVTYCSTPRLRLAVVGAPGSGKTHLLAAAARELTAGHYPVRGSTTPSASTTAIEQIAGAILDERRPPSPTPAGAPPLPMLIRDRDPFGRSDVLVTVGESSTASGIRRADGFLIAFDATQPLEAQRKWLAELAAARLLGRSPILLALTKIDLIRGRETERLFADLTAIEPTGRSISRAVIRHRSVRTARYVSLLWPGWDPAAELGRRELPWYPVSPVGLNEPGETDLRRRIIEPFATLEPLLGLVHACGFPVLI